MATAAGPIAVGVRKKDPLVDRLQDRLDSTLGDFVSKTRDPKNTDPGTIGFWNLDPAVGMTLVATTAKLLNQVREASRRQPAGIPDLVYAWSSMWIQISEDL